MEDEFDRRAGGSADSDRDWEYFGRSDPYYGVLTSAEYRQRNLSEEAKARFFESGRVHIGKVLSVIRTYLVPDFQPRQALDFGCGVGRAVIPLAALCDSVVGVDVSESMLREAQHNCAARGITNARFVRSDDALTAVSGQFDFIHSFIVFQHIPCDRGERLFKRLIDLLADGGVGVLHFTYLRKESALRGLLYRARKAIPLLNGLVNVILFRQPFAYPMMQMNAYNLGRLFQILQENNCHHVCVRFSSHVTGRLRTGTPVYGVVLFFQKKVLANWEEHGAGRTA